MHENSCVVSEKDKKRPPVGFYSQKARLSRAHLAVTYLVPASETYASSDLAAGLCLAAAA